MLLSGAVFTTRTNGKPVAFFIDYQNKEIGSGMCSNVPRFQNLYAAKASVLQLSGLTVYFKGSDFTRNLSCSPTILSKQPSGFVPNYPDSYCFKTLLEFLEHACKFIRDNYKLKEYRIPKKSYIPTRICFSFG